MQNQNRRIRIFLNMLLEAGMILLAYQLTVFIRFSLMKGTMNEVMTWGISWRIVLLYSVGIVCVYALLHLYAPVFYIRARKELFRVTLVNLIGTITFGFLLYILKLFDFSRIALVLFFIISTALICMKRILYRIAVRKHNLLGDHRIHVILVGSGKLARQYVRDVQNNPHLGISVDGYIQSNSQNLEKIPCYGEIDRVEALLDGSPADQIVVALEPDETGYIQKVLSAVEKEGIAISMIPFYSDFYPSHPTFETFGKTKLINLRATPLDNIANAAIKRAMDLVGSFILIILLSPLMVITAVGVKLSSPGPIFFKQARVGKGKKPFTMLKFRSMRINSAETTGWSTTSDPRRTKFGSFIRKYSIDELPQLFNVFKGDMSLIGPRPEVPYYVYQFKETVPRYLVRQQVRPGMTGWAQVHGLRGDTSIEARVEYDIWYIENWSLLLDIRILFLTLLGGFINTETLPAQGKQ